MCCCCSSKPVAWYLLGEQTRIVPSHLFYSLKRNYTRSYERKRTRDTENIDSPFYMHITRTHFAPAAMQYTNAQRVIKPLANPSETAYTLPERERERERTNWNIESGSLWEITNLPVSVQLYPIRTRKHYSHTHTHTMSEEFTCVSVLPATGAIWCATYVSLTYTHPCTYIKYNHRYSGRCRTLMIMKCICFSASGTISATRLGALRADSDPIRKGTWNKTEAKVFQLHLSLKTKESSSKWYLVY